MKNKQKSGILPPNLCKKKLKKMFYLDSNIVLSSDGRRVLVITTPEHFKSKCHHEKFGDFHSTFPKQILGLVCCKAFKMRN
jgi:hypothetical protein